MQNLKQRKNWAKIHNIIFIIFLTNSYAWISTCSPWELGCSDLGWQMGQNICLSELFFNHVPKFISWRFILTVHTIHQILPLILEKHFLKKNHITFLSHQYFFLFSEDIRFPTRGDSVADPFALFFPLALGSPREAWSSWGWWDPRSSRNPAHATSKTS